MELFASTLSRLFWGILGDVDLADCESTFRAAECLLREKAVERPRKQSATRTSAAAIAVDMITIKPANQFGEVGGLV